MDGEWWMIALLLDEIIKGARGGNYHTFTQLMK